MKLDYASAIINLRIKLELESVDDKIRINKQINDNLKKCYKFEK